MTEKLLSAREAAKILNCGTSTVWRRASEGIIPRPLKIGGTSRWKLSDIEAVIANAEAHREVE
ncbi:MAG: helix-turn-helix transcriptional regulator [Rhodobacterales bacterium]